MTGSSRLRRSDLSRPGITRQRAGRSFRYVAGSGASVGDADRERIGALAIPPAWKDVWICADGRGHIQATGVDAAGRRQYLYHPKWRQRQDTIKFAHMLEFAKHLPRARVRVRSALHGETLTRDRVLAGVFRVLDLCSTRIGSEAYGDTFGLATMRRRHVSVDGPLVAFSFAGKGGVQQRSEVRDPALARLMTQLLDRPDRNRELLAWCDEPNWRDVRSSDINVYLRELVGCECSAKDFRTWNATVLMAVTLAKSPQASTSAARRRTIRAGYATVAEHLGNTPAIARSSYVDPRVVDCYNGGVVASWRGNRRDRQEAAVRRMLLAV